MAHVATGTLSGDSSLTSVAVNIPAGSAVDQIAVVAIYLETANEISQYPGGFFLKARRTENATTQGSLAVFWKRLTAADSGTYTFTGWGAAAYVTAACSLFSGRKKYEDPWDPSYGDANTNVNTGNNLPVTINPSANCDLFLFHACWGFTTTSTFTPPANYVERRDDNTFTIDTRDNYAGGSTGAVSATYSGTDFLKTFHGALLPDNGAPTPLNSNTDGYSQMFRTYNGVYL